MCCARITRRSDTLAQMSPESIYAALTTGAMVQQAAKLSNDEKLLVAGFFGGRPVGTADAGDMKNMTNHCASNAQLSNPEAGVAWNGWGNNLYNTRFQNAKSAGMTADDVSKLKLKWSFGLPAGARLMDSRRWRMAGFLSATTTVMCIRWMRTRAASTGRSMRRRRCVRLLRWGR